MGSQDEKYGLEHALGNTNISRVTNPTIRGSVRRSDPDGGHASPYFNGLTGTGLNLEVSPVVGDIVIPFASDDMEDAIATINAASPANLRADDDDGYLRVTNLNSGGKNKIIVKGGTSLSILGFKLTPEPGSASYSGELSTSAPGRSITSNQSNPQGTAFVANNEDLTSSVLNRAIYGGLRHVESALRGLDIEIPIVKKIAVTVVSHAPTGKNVFVIQDGTLRFPIQGFGIAGNPATAAMFDKLVSLRSSPNDLEIFDPLNAGGIPRVSAVYYNDGTNATADNTTNFATWGTIDGKSIFASQTKNKQAPVTITAIRGNILIAPTALFITNVCQPGDTVVIEAADNNTPFNHNGEYIVVEVLSETMLVVRAKSLHETTFVSTDKPTELNSNLPGGTTYGTVRVIIGATIPMSKLMFEVDSWVPLGSYFARVLCFRRIRDLLANELGEVLNPGNAALGTLLNTHFTGTGAHAAANITYAGGVAWADGTTNPSTTVELQLDKIVADLAAATGAIKIGANSGPAWADATTNPAASIEARLDKIITDLSAATGAIKIGADTGAAWADATTNPAASVEARLDKIITDLAGATGTGKIQGSAVGSDLSAATLASQISSLATGWAKLDRLNTFTLNQTFSGGLAGTLTGEHKHGEYIYTVPATSSLRVSTTNPPSTYLKGLTGGLYNDLVSGSVDPIIYPLIGFKQGDRIIRWRLYTNDTTVNGGHTIRLFKYNSASFTETALGTLQTTNGTGQQVFGNLSLSIDINDFDEFFFLRVVPNAAAGAGLSEFYHAQFGLSRP